jgi:hypothetical protein
MEIIKALSLRQGKKNPAEGFAFLDSRPASGYDWGRLKRGMHIQEITI